MKQRAAMPTYSASLFVRVRGNRHPGFAKKAREAIDRAMEKETSAVGATRKKTSATRPPIVRVRLTPPQIEYLSRYARERGIGNTDALARIMEGEK